MRLTDHSHPITLNLPTGFQYGTGTARDQYLQPPRIQYLPQSAVSPQFYADDPAARVLGMAASIGEPGLVVKEFESWRSIYSAAPVLSWQLLQAIARFAGVHLYAETGDMLWANRSFLALYSQAAGLRRIRFPRPVRVVDAYTGQSFTGASSSLILDMRAYETRLFFLHPVES